MCLDVCICINIYLYNKERFLCSHFATLNQREREGKQN